VPSVYLKCANDATIPIELQTMFAEKIPGCDIVVCSSGHSPFLSQPEEVVKAIVKAADKPSKSLWTWKRGHPGAQACVVSNELDSLPS